MSIFCGLIGCDLEDSSEAPTNSNSGMVGTWYGTKVINMSVADSGFTSSQQSQAELYWVIKQNDNGNLEFPNCYGGYDEITVTNNKFTFSNIEYTIESESVIRGGFIREGNYYTSLVIELNRLNDKVDALGDVSAIWSNTGGVTQTSDLFCAEIGSLSLTTSNGDNIQEEYVSVSNGEEFSYLSSKTGTDVRQYIQIKYDGNSLYGFDDNGMQNLEMTFDQNIDKGFSATFSAEKDGASLTGAINVSIENVN